MQQHSENVCGCRRRSMFRRGAKLVLFPRRDERERRRCARYTAWQREMLSKRAPIKVTYFAIRRLPPLGPRVESDTTMTISSSLLAGASCALALLPANDTRSPLDWRKNYILSLPLARSRRPVPMLHARRPFFHHSSFVSVCHVCAFRKVGF